MWFVTDKRGSSCNLGVCLTSICIVFYSFWSFFSGFFCLNWKGQLKRRQEVWWLESRGKSCSKGLWPGVKPRITEMRALASVYRNELFVNVMEDKFMAAWCYIYALLCKKKLLRAPCQHSVCIHVTCTSPSMKRKWKHFVPPQWEIHFRSLPLCTRWNSCRLFYFVSWLVFIWEKKIEVSMSNDITSNLR